MIPEILAIQEQIGADSELTEALSVVTMLVCPHSVFRYARHDGGTDPDTGFPDLQYIATCTTCGEQFFDGEIEQELARQAESGGAR